MEIESMRIANSQKESERANLKARYEDSRTENSMLQKEIDNLKAGVSHKHTEFDNELERVKTEHENEVRDLERMLSEKRDELDKQFAEKGKLLQRCESLEAKMLHLKNNSGAAGSSDNSKIGV